jgi:predicted  nucleic acid-binding Zn-ribbon protein
MAANQQKEEIILEFKVDQSELLKEAGNTKKAIIGLQDETRELNKQFKDGKITLDEYAKESVRLENQIKKEKATLNDLNKSLNTVSGSLDAQRRKLAELTKERNSLNKTTVEGIKRFDQLNKEIKELNETIGKHEQAGGDFRRNVGNYTESIKQAAGELNVMGHNVGDVTTSLSNFVNPATASIALVGALGTLYAKSTIGAKDMAFAQNQLNFALNLTGNNIARLISSGENGEGLLTKLLNLSLKFSGIGLLDALGITNIQGDSKTLALIQEQLSDLAGTELDVRNKINERLEDNQQLLTEMGSEQEDYNKKLDLSNEIITNIRRNEEELRQVLQEELKLQEQQIAIDKDNSDFQNQARKTRNEISKLEKDSERQVQTIVRMQDDINKKLVEEARLRGFINKQGGRSRTSATVSSQTPDLINEQQVVADAQVRLANGMEQRITRFKNQQSKKRREDDDQEAINFREAQQMKLRAASEVAGALAQVFQDGSELQKVFALASIATDTAEAIAALTAASEQNPANGFTFGAAGIVQYAAGIARILGNIAAAKNVLSQAAGGGNFVTKGPSLLLVGDNPGGVERVTVEPLSGKGKTRVAQNSNLIAMAGGGTLTAYSDGNYLANTGTRETNQAIMMANMMKRMPRPIVQVVDIKRGLKNVDIKTTSAGR